MTDSSKTNPDTLLMWNAPERPYKKRDREFYITGITLAFLLIVIAFFLKEWLLIGAVLAVVFVNYALVAVEPAKIANKITKKGIWTGETFYRFSEISQYWFENQLENLALILLLKKQTRRAVLVAPNDQKDQVDQFLREYLVFREKPLKSLVDKISGWMSAKFPLEEKAPPR